MLYGLLLFHDSGGLQKLGGSLIKVWGVSTLSLVYELVDDSMNQFCLNIGWLYTRLVASNSYSPEPGLQKEPSEETALLMGHDHDIKMKESIHEFMAMCVSH